MSSITGVLKTAFSVYQRWSRRLISTKENKMTVSVHAHRWWQQITNSINPDVILSLTRTRRVGYLRDIRRLTVALSRARLGLYILGRREVFESCYELRGALERLLTRSNTLQLTTGEIFPTSRLLGDDVQTSEIVGVEHLGQYVYEMTQAKISA